MYVMWTVARKEIQDRLRNRWILLMTGLMAGLALGLVFLGSSPTGTLGASPLAIMIVSLSSLSIYLIPLIALLLSHDAIVGEVESGTLLLLFSYPVTRRQVVVGKCVGHGMVLACVTVLGYGAAGVALLFGDATVDPATWHAFGGFLWTSVLLGWVFIALAMWASVVVPERAVAVAVAVGIWLFFVIVFDVLLLGVVVSQQAWVDAAVFPYLLLLNPADIFRLLNLGGFEAVGALSGMAGLASQSGLTRAWLWAGLFLWIAIPLGMATLSVMKREL